MDLQLRLFDQTILPIMIYSCEIFGYENYGLFEKNSYSVSSLYHPSKKKHSTLYGLRWIRQVPNRNNHYNQND